MILFISPANVGELIRISGEDAKHLFVLRPQINDTLSLSDGSSFAYDGIISLIDREGVTVKIMNKKEFERESKVKIKIFTAFLKGDKCDQVVQKAVELGVCEITFFNSKNCVARFEDKEKEKIARFSKIAKMAAMQCGREYIPIINSFLSYENALKELKELNGTIFYEKAEALLSNYLLKNNKYEKTAFMTGPEGGFSESEAEMAKQLSIPMLSLGKRILRAETAPVCALSVYMAYYGEI